MKKYLILTQILYVICFVPWLIVWGISFMAFDNGISMLAVSLVIGIGLYPVAVIACSIVSWVFRDRRKRMAIIVNLIPLLWVLGGGIPLLFLNFS